MEELIKFAAVLILASVLLSVVLKIVPTRLSQWRRVMLAAAIGNIATMAVLMSINHWAPHDAATYGFDWFLWFLFSLLSFAFFSAPAAWLSTYFLDFVVAERRP
ncbi:hypothetical protein [Erythrobacter rubeus]|uniref:Uncharacterized protein n=1 Tax=Erythrobacter rubeus TaxID=2760803 RepID=A0ABR8KM56_9SPHN|nr:hypothetical protein [Erythrobacter rubeus]MBD2841562.1 hypothetical protein [Erythrobacter rubeus]